MAEVKGAGLKGVEIKAPNAIVKNRILTVPNQLTFLRLAFLPFFNRCRATQQPCRA